MADHDNLLSPPTRKPQARKANWRQSLFGGRPRGRRLLAPLLALAALAGLAAWLIVDSTSNDNNGSNGGQAPTAVSTSGLRSFAQRAGQPVYWVGARPSAKYEITQNSRGVYVRYLPPDVKAGDSRAFLTVATYPVQNAYAATKSKSGSGTVTHDIAGGGVATYHTSHPTSVYVAYPGSEYQIEVYAPKAAAAHYLAFSGRVQPVLNPPGAAASQAEGPKAASPADLRALATKLGHPIYWAGPRPNTTYELWQTPRGYTYIRYLPTGVPVGGGAGRYLIVATYPLKDAFKITKKASAKKNGRTIVLNLPDGGVGAYSKRHPTNVYVAYPGVDVQVEVYDPHAKVTPKLVASGQIVPVR